MSAFLCEPEIFDGIANTLAYYADHRPYHADQTSHFCAFILSLQVRSNGTIKLKPTLHERTAEFAKRLYNMNLDAISQRYASGAGDDYGYQFKNRLPIGCKVALYKKIRCLIYQCSEGDVPETDLYKQLNEISNALAHDIVTHSKEYDNVAWG